jgi:hypothetical protein
MLFRLLKKKFLKVSSLPACVLMAREISFKYKLQEFKFKIQPESYIKILLLPRSEHTPFLLQKPLNLTLYR